MSGYIQVLTTIGTAEHACRLAATLVEARLAACVQVVGPITSTYWWQGKQETSQEWQCLAKTHERLFQRLQERIRAEHPYDLPEIIATPIVAGNAEYLAWLERELEPAEA